MIWYVRRRDFSDIALRCFSEVGGVGLLGVLVPVRGKEALAARLLEAESHASDSAEQIDKCIVRHKASAP
jgi:hypothetical protein